MGDTVRRQWEMMKMLPMSPAKIDADSLHQKLEDKGYKTTKRTVERDLQKLAEIFTIDIDERSKPFGWSWGRDARVFDIPSIDNRTALTFKMIEQYMAHLLPSEVLNDIKPYFKQSSNILRETVGAKLSSWNNKVEVIDNGLPLIPPSINSEVISTIYTALFEGNRLSVNNNLPDGTVKHYEDINPLGLIFGDNTISLVCTFRDYDEPRRILLHRLSDVTILSKSSRHIKGFVLKDYVHKEHVMAIPLSDEDIQVHLRFTGRAGYHLIERKLSEDQVVEKIEDYIEVKATVPDTLQFKWWLQGFGDQVEILEPVSLREEFREIAENMAKLYRD